MEPLVQRRLNNYQCIFIVNKQHSYITASYEQSCLDKTSNFHEIKKYAFLHEIKKKNSYTEYSITLINNTTITTTMLFFS